MRTRLVFWLLVWTGLATTTGCVHYRLGSMLPADVRTVYIPTCVNKTTEPQLELDVTRAILAQIQTDGTLRVAPEHAADSILNVTVTDFDLKPVAYQFGEGSTVNQYRMSIKASFVLRRRADNRVVAESPALVGWHDMDFAGDMTSSKAVGLLPAAEDLGRRIVGNIVQYWP